MWKKLIAKPSFILSFILLIFFLKGVFVATLHPMFDGQDEARHYNSVQYLTEPKTKNWEMTKRPHIQNKENLDEYNFSEEMIRSGQVADFDKFRHSLYETVDFSDTWDGKNEKEIEATSWRPYNYFSPPDIVSGSAYHSLMAKIETALAQENILVRFYTIRLFSVVLGTLAVLFFYLIAKNIGFSPSHSLLMTAILAFQPKLTDYMTNINYDVITIPMFFLFTLGGVLALKNGLNWKNFLIMLFSAYVGYSAKGTSVVLFGVLAFLLLYFLYQKIQTKSQNFRRFFAFILAFSLAILFVFFKKYLPLEGGIMEALTSFIDYLDESLTFGRFALSERTYWGSLTWVNSFVLANFTTIIWFFETFAVIGLLFYFLSKKKPDWLPEKKYAVFFIVMVLALQLGIRAYDWKIFSIHHELLLGTPGRYFLPNLASHLLLVFIGLGMFLHAFNWGKYFKTVLSLSLILMFSLSLYLIFDVLVYRYYL